MELSVLASTAQAQATTTTTTAAAPRNNANGSELPGAANPAIDSLQTSLGAAYMLLTAETKAAQLQEQLLETKQRLRDEVGASDALLRAHAQGVADFGGLKHLFDKCRTDAEALGSLLQQESSSEQVATAASALLERLGSSMRVHGSEADAASAAEDDNGTDENELVRRLREAEAHQVSVAAQLHSRESQLTLLRHELHAADGERDRYEAILADASVRLAAGVGDRTARRIGLRAEANAQSGAEEESRLHVALERCADLIGGLITAERHSKKEKAAALLPLQPLQPWQGQVSGRADSAETTSKKGARRAARQAAYEELRSLASSAACDAAALRERREDADSITTTLREMLSALDAERSARIRLQELLARDWHAQTGRLQTLLREQDMLLEVALHKLECHGGVELATALTERLHSLRLRVTDAGGEQTSALTARGPATDLVPDVLAHAMSSAQRSAQRFFGSIGGLAPPSDRAAAAHPPGATPENDRHHHQGGGATTAAAAAASTDGADATERLGVLAKSVLDQIQARLATAAHQASVLSSRQVGGMEAAPRPSRAPS